MDKNRRDHGVSYDAGDLSKATAIDRLRPDTNEEPDAFLEGRQYAQSRKIMWSWIGWVLFAIAVGIWVARRIFVESGTDAQELMDQVGWLFMVMGVWATAFQWQWRGYIRGMDDWA